MWLVVEPDRDDSALAASARASGACEEIFDDFAMRNHVLQH
jgi:hypothetical protein